MYRVVYNSNMSFSVYLTDVFLKWNSERLLEPLWRWRFMSSYIETADAEQMFRSQHISWCYRSSPSTTSNAKAYKLFFFFLQKICWRQEHFFRKHVSSRHNNVSCQYKYNLFYFHNVTCFPNLMHIQWIMLLFSWSTNKSCIRNMYI